MPKINGGYFIKARCIKGSAIYKAPPYIREIWDYLLREANHTDKKYNGYIIKRGQLFRSYKDIRDDLSWKVGYRTERYNENQMKMGMRYLKKQLMITLLKQPRGNIITICNYDFFQNPKNYEATSEATDETTNGQPMGNQGVLSINKNDNKVNKEKKINKRKTFIPDNYKLTEKHIKYANDKNIKTGIEDIFEGFCINHKKRGTKFVCWYAAWQNWIRNKIKWDKEKNEADNKDGFIDEYQPPLDEVLS